MNRFHTQLRNESRAIPQGNGREGIGMEIGHPSIPVLQEARVFVSPPQAGHGMDDKSLPGHPIACGCEHCTWERERGGL